MALLWERCGYEDYRAKIEGGWLVKTKETEYYIEGVGVGIGLTFVPDPKYNWKIDKKIIEKIEEIEEINHLMRIHGDYYKGTELWKRKNKLIYYLEKKGHYYFTKEERETEEDF